MEEETVYTLIKEMLIKNNRTVEYIRYVSTGNYLDIKAFQLIARMKVKGRKKICINRKNRTRNTSNLRGFKM